MSSAEDIQNPTTELLNEEQEQNNAPPDSEQTTEENVGGQSAPESAGVEGQPHEEQTEGEGTEGQAGSSSSRSEGEDVVKGEEEREANVETEEIVEEKGKEGKKPELDTQLRPEDSKGKKDGIEDRPGIPKVEDVPELGQDTHSDAASRSPSPRSPRGGSPPPAPQREPSPSPARERRNRKRRQKKVRTYPSEDEEAQGHQGFSMEGALPQGKHQMSITKDVPQQLAERPRPQQQKSQQQPAPVAQPQQQQGKKKDPMRLRLDLNLDIEVTLKARIHGDIELSLLWVAPPSIAGFCVISKLTYPTREG